MFEKLFKYIGKSIKALIDRTDEPHCLRLHKNRVFYVRESLMRRATNVRNALGSSPSCKTCPNAARPAVALAAVSHRPWRDNAAVMLRVFKQHLRFGFPITYAVVQK